VPTLGQQALPSIIVAFVIDADAMYPGICQLVGKLTTRKHITKSRLAPLCNVTSKSFDITLAISLIPSVQKYSFLPAELFDISAINIATTDILWPQIQQTVHLGCIFI
jgi:hypothetical protein